MTGDMVVVTGGSRGIGAATVALLASGGNNVVFCYREKDRRAASVRDRARRTTPHVRVDSVRADITTTAGRDALALIADGPLTAIVLNAAGGMETLDPTYAERLNADAQIAVLDTLAANLRPDGIVIYPTSLQSHRYGLVPEFDSYRRIAKSKHRGEKLIREYCSERDIRCTIVVSDMVENSPAALLMDLREPEAAEERRATALRSGIPLPTVTDVAQRIVDAVVVGGGDDLDTVHVSGSSLQFASHDRKKKS